MLFAGDTAGHPRPKGPTPGTEFLHQHPPGYGEIDLVIIPPTPHNNVGEERGVILESPCLSVKHQLTYLLPMITGLV